jgi:hypothetical protein
MEAQISVKQKIIFNIDTLFNNKEIELNSKDSAKVFFDGGFFKDTVTICINETTKYRNIFESDPSIDLAGIITILKTKNTIIKIQINSDIYESFKLESLYPIIHINYFNKKLTLTYTNKIYEYD